MKHAIIVTGLLLLVLTPTGALASPKPDLTAAVYKVMEARAQAGLKPGNETRLDPLYDPRPGGGVTGPKLLAWEKARARHLQSWQAQAGVSIQKAGVAVILRNVQVAGERASVQVREHLRLRWQYRTRSGENLTQMVYDHEMELYRVNGQWLVRQDAYVDTLFQSHLGPDHQTPRPLPVGRPDRPTFLTPSLIIPRRTESEGRYQPERAVAYATRWWDDFNPRYRSERDDCANFISQALGDQEGGSAPHWPGEWNAAWYYDFQTSTGSRPWINADGLQRFLLHPPRGPDFAYGTVLAEGTLQQISSALGRLSPGDVITYAWPDQAGQNDGVYDHSTLVTAIDSGGAPLVTAHTHPVYNAPWHLGHLTDATRFKLIQMRQRFPLP
ncbi:MAG TPA: amidase domain-containing protein [Symbiobacteriaceae bacterium]|nr:amidase domain-containing protein [Symbiobacteriaceae bacterium]